MWNTFEYVTAYLEAAKREVKVSTTFRCNVTKKSWKTFRSSSFHKCNHHVGGEVLVTIIESLCVRERQKEMEEVERGRERESERKRQREGER